jgi:hypothetical protein
MAWIRPEETSNQGNSSMTISHDLHNDYQHPAIAVRRADCRSLADARGQIGGAGRSSTAFLQNEPNRCFAFNEATPATSIWALKLSLDGLRARH